MFLSFGVEGRSEGLTIKDLFGYYRYQIMTDKEDFLRGLKSYYGEDNLIERLNGNYNNNSTSNITKTSSNNDINNSSNLNKPKISLKDIPLMDGDEISQPLKEIAKDLFTRCDKDRDGILNAKEYNDYFRLIDMEPVRFFFYFFLFFPKYIYIYFYFIILYNI